MISGKMYRLDAVNDKLFSYGWHQDHIIIDKIKILIMVV